MAGTGIWLSDQDLSTTGGAIWAQQQMQSLGTQMRAGQDWANQMIARAQAQAREQMQTLTQAPTAPEPPPSMPTAVSSPAPPTPTPQVPQPAPALSTDVPPPPPPPPPVPMPSAPSPLQAGQDWASQQIQNLLNPGTSQNAPGTATATPGIQTPPTPSATPSVPGAPAGPQPSAPGDFIDQARQAAQAAGIDPDIFSRQIQQESGFNPAAKSGAGAVGIAQFMPQTAAGMGIDPNDPVASLKAAAQLDAQNLSKYAGDWSKALAAYNAGPGNVDQYGGVPPFQETQNYVKNILGGAQNVVQQGMTAVNTAVDAVHSAVARVSQFGLGLSSGDAMAFCGPAAALAFAQTYGRNPTVDEAKQLAQQVGWDPNQGMAGPQSEVKLLNAMGVDAHMTSGVDWQQVGRDASGGNPVIIDTPGHYYYIDGYNADSGKFHVGTSGTDLRGGSEWMSSDQINGMPQSGGAARAAIYADHPLSQGTSSAQPGSAQRTMGTMQPASSTIDPLAPYSTADPYGYGRPLAPGFPDIAGGLLGGAGRALGGLGGGIQDQVQQTLQAVQDVGSSGTQRGLDLLSQGRDLASSGNDILNQGLPQLNAANDLLQPLRQDLGSAGDALNQALYGPSGRRPTQDEMAAGLANAQASNAALGMPQIAMPGNPLEALSAFGSMSPFGIGEEGERATELRNQAIEAANPLRDQPFVGGLSTLAAQTALDPTNLFLVPGMSTLGRTAIPEFGRLLAGESGQLDLSRLGEQRALLPDQPYQPMMPEGAGPGGVADVIPSDAGPTLDQLRLAIDQRRALAERAANGAPNVTEAPPFGRFAPPQSTLPGFEDAAGPSGMQRVLQAVRDFHVGNVISSPATLAHVALTSAISPLWSLASRGIEDLATLQPSRAAGSILGAQTGLQGLGNDLLEGLANVYSRPTALPGVMGRVWQTPAALHSMFQTAAGNAITDMELGRLAGQQATREGLQGGEWIARARDLIANPLAGWTDTAQGVANRATLRGDLGGFGSFMSNLMHNDPTGFVSNALFPVFRIGMNSLTQMAERSPLGLAGTAVDVARGAAGFGPYAGGRFAQPLESAVTPLGERLTNNLVGTALSVWLAGKAVDGTITGEGPDDPGQAATLRAQGWQPHSLLVAGQYIDYSHLPPGMQGPLRAAGAYADAVEAARQAGKPLSTQSPLGAAAASLFHTVGTTFADDTPLRTISDLYQLVKDPQQAPSIAASTLANIVGSYVPMSAAVRGATIATDPYARRPNALFPGNFGQALEQNLPVLRGNVPVAQDVLGRQQQNPQMGLGALLPNIGRGTPSPVAGAFAESGLGLGQPPPTLAWNGREIRLTPDEQQAYQRVAGDRLQQIAGRLVSSPGWQDLQARADSPDQQTANRARAIMQMRLQPLEQIAHEYAATQVIRAIPAADRVTRAQWTSGPRAVTIGYEPDVLGQQSFLQTQAAHQALMNSLLSGQGSSASQQAAQLAGLG